MLASLTIRARLIATVSLLFLLALGVGVAALLGLRAANDAHESTYSNQLASALALGEADLSLTRARTALDRAMLYPDSPEAPGLLDRTEELTRRSDAAWKRFMALPRNSEEDQLAVGVSAKRDAANREGIAAIIAALRAKDRALADQIADGRLSRLFRDANDSSLKLSQFQLKMAAGNFEASQVAYRHFRNGVIAAIVLALLVAAACAVFLLRAIVGPLELALKQFDRIAAGDLSHPVQVTRRDEMGRLLEGLARLASQLAVSAVEVASQGGAVVSDVLATMGAISTAARTVAEIIGVVDGIAFQTNILALNAAVEAARAGDQARQLDQAIAAFRI